MQQEFDVIVVGAGGSGLAAAVGSAERGLSVLILEKQPQPGGTTGIAVGSLTANRTRLQEAASIKDSLQAHVEDAGLFAPPEIEARNQKALRHHFLSQGGETLAWLESMGLHFHGPNPEPPNRVPRMHNVVPNAKAYIAALQGRLFRLGGRLRCGVTVTGLRRDRGRVTGVDVKGERGKASYLARRGVVLACGDYANSQRLIARFKGDAFARVEGIHPHATGEGHQLAESVGAKLLNMDITYGPELRFVAPPGGKAFHQLLPVSGPLSSLAGWLLPWIPKFLLHAYIKRLLVTWQHPEASLFDDGALLVNRNGRRFCNEQRSPERELAVTQQAGKSAFILLDEHLCRRYSAWPHFVSTAPEVAYAYVEDYLRLRPDIACQGRSLEALGGCGLVDLDGLVQTVNAFNQAVQGGEANPPGRAGPSRPLEGQWWVLLGPVRAYFTTTEGGAAIDRNMRVLDARGEPIPGLLAVGQNGLGGQILWGHGLHIAWALTSGRLAGATLAAPRQEDRKT